jgi:hypothetical protein
VEEEQEQEEDEGDPPINQPLWYEGATFTCQVKLFLKKLDTEMYKLMFTYGDTRTPHTL